MTHFVKFHRYNPKFHYTRRTCNLSHRVHLHGASGQFRVIVGGSEKYQRVGIKVAPILSINCLSLRAAIILRTIRAFFFCCCSRLLFVLRSSFELSGYLPSSRTMVPQYSLSTINYQSTLLTQLISLSYISNCTYIYYKRIKINKNISSEVSTPTTTSGQYGHH